MAGSDEDRPDGKKREYEETRVVSSGASSSAPSRAVANTFSPGDLVADRYHIIRFVAVGGMGEVYEAEDRELRETVALKTIRPEISENPESLDRFRREINVAHRISHPNVSRIFDIGYHQRTDEDGRTANVAFLTMEFLAGEELSRRLRERGRMSTEEALPIIRQVAAALDEAHKKGVIHRDIKANNVMLVPEGDSGEVRVVVADFGLARAIGGDKSFAVSISGSEAIVGTPAYMAPEQLKGAEITPATDIYALGVLIYELLTGQYPFEADSALSMAAMKLTEAPTPPSRHVEGIDPRWEKIILRCLELDPKDRYQSARDVVRAASGEDLPARGKGRKIGQRMLVLGLAGIAVVAALFVWLVTTDRSRPEEPPVANEAGRASPLASTPAVREAVGGESPTTTKTRTEIPIPTDGSSFHLVYYNQFTPFSFVDDDGRLRGILIDIANRVLRDELGLLVHHTAHPWSAAQKLVREGEADGFVTSPTPERKAYTEIVEEPFLLSVVTIFTRAGSPLLPRLSNVRVVEDLANLQLVTYRGNGWSKENLKGLRVSWVADLSHALKTLDSGNADALVGISEVGRWYVKELGLADRIVELNSPIDSVGFHLCIRRESGFAGLGPQISATLQRLQQEGVLQEILEEYL